MFSTTWKYLSVLLLVSLFNNLVNANPTTPKPTTPPVKVYTLTCGSSTATAGCRAFPLYFSCSAAGKLKFNRLPEEIDECLRICKCV
ncbi:hypothetical protein VTL71DRAFT_4678 [Oculimacula yallundae]|uniref:Uncharacterized protein n=1 Tax=Oculimacula yallundae TaxID=86028 RepID=A0ABR4C2Q0_9HELO